MKIKKWVLELVATDIDDYEMCIYYRFKVDTSNIGERIKNSYKIFEYKQINEWIIFSKLCKPYGEHPK